VSERITRTQRDAILAVLRRRYDEKIERWQDLDEERVTDIKAAGFEATSMLTEILDAMVDPGQRPASEAPRDVAAGGGLAGVVDPESESIETNRYLFKQLCLRHGILLGEPISAALRKLHAGPGSNGQASTSEDGQ
jgi:hypothetical protein